MMPRSLLLGSVAFALAAGCVLPSFENVADVSGGRGGAPSAGGADDEGGAGSKAEGGGPAAGEGGGGALDSIEVATDQYVVAQGKSLVLTARTGVLSNDSAGLRVVSVDAADPSRAPDLDASLDIAEDGSLTFEPATEFFGRYVAEYTVEDAHGQSARTTVAFIVQPVAAALGVVEQGAGGVVLGASGSDALGTALSALGDVNGDGYDDFAIGAPGAAMGDGAVYVVFGRPGFEALTLGSLAASSEESRYAVLAGTASSPIGGYVASAGTFDTAPSPDILVGAPAAEQNAGKLFVAFGGAELKASVELSETTPAARAIWFSGAADEQLGLFVAGGGDYNGDEKSDIFAGLYPGGQAKGGVCGVFENPIAAQPLATTTHATLNDSNIFALPLSLAVAGDVDGDGKDDVLVSSRRHVALLLGQGNGDVSPIITDMPGNGLGLLRTRPSGVMGVAAVAPAGDVNGDDKADFVFCDRFPTAPACYVIYRAPTALDSLDDADWELSGFAASAALPLLANGADLNQDGFAELVVADENGVYVVFGRDVGFGDVDVSSLGNDGFSLSTASAASALASVGDVNGDGYGDFAVGDAAAQNGAGRVYVVFGGPFSSEQR